MIYLAITGWIGELGKWGLTVVLAAIGVGFIIVGLFEMWGGVKGDTKEWKKVIEGFGIGFVGGLFLVWPAMNVIGFFKQGKEIPHSA